MTRTLQATAHWIPLAQVPLLVPWPQELKGLVALMCQGIDCGVFHLRFAAGKPDAAPADVDFA